MSRSRSLCVSRFISSFPTSSSTPQPKRHQLNKKSMKLKHFKLLVTLAAGMAAAGSSRAADTFFNLDTDPNNDPQFIIVGSHKAASFSSATTVFGANDYNPTGIATNGNPATGGYLS